MSPIQQMKTDYEQGMSIKDIAHKHHAQRADVREAIRLNGWKRLVTVGGAHTDPSVKAAIRADYLRGCGPPCLRKKHGIHNTTLYRWIREEGWLADREARASLPPSTSEILALDPVAFDTRIAELLQAEQDLAALRERHAAQTAALAQVRDDYLADDARYLRQHREDAATIAELRENAKAAVAVCPDCGEVTCCDEDRCCVSCGRDLIILADRHSADLLAEVLSEIEALRSRQPCVVNATWIEQA